MIVESICREFKLTEDYDKDNFRWNKYERGGFRPYVIAFDTETYYTNGNLLCLCNSENDNTLYGRADELMPFTSYFWYFLDLKKSKSDIFVAWNLKFDAEVILKSLGKDNLKSFYQDGEKFKGTYNGFKISYLPKKYLNIRRGKDNLEFFDAMQFYNSSLDNAAKKFIGEQKSYTGKYQDKNFPDIIEQEELTQIKLYCMLDASLTKRLMNVWLDGFYANFKYYPDKFYSAGYLSANYLRSQLEYFPIFNDVPFEVSKLAWNSYFGGRFEIFKRGLLEGVHHYDIKSAYPYAMTLLYNLLSGEWKKLSLENFQDIKSNLGFAKVDVTVNEKRFSPFMVRQLNGLVTCPSGRFTTYTTLKELKSMYGYDIEIHSLDGWYFEPTDYKKTLFNKLIQGMFDTRMKQKDETQKYVYKVLINSIYGKFAQSRPEPKGLFNPVIAAFITGYCRSQILDACRNNKDDIVMIATDGIFSTEKLNVPEGNKLGEYEYQYHPKFCGIMSGVYSFNTIEDSKLKYHNRGFSLKIYDENDKPIKFDLDEMKLRFDGEDFVFDIRNMRPLNITQSIIQSKFDTSKISKMIFVDRKLQLNGDRKRIWLNRMKSIKDINDSWCLEL